MIDMLLIFDRAQDIETYINMGFREGITQCLDQLEDMIRGISSPEIRAIEILGGVLGLIIGIVQDGILLLLG